MVVDVLRQRQRAVHQSADPVARTLQQCPTVSVCISKVRAHTVVRSDTRHHTGKPHEHVIMIVRRGSPRRCRLASGVEGCMHASGMPHGVIVLLLLCDAHRLRLIFVEILLLQPRSATLRSPRVLSSGAGAGPFLNDSSFYALCCGCILVHAQGRARPSAATLLSSRTMPTRRRRAVRRNDRGVEGLT